MTMSTISLRSNHPGGKLVTYAYDPVGNRVSMGYPDGKVATYAYDAVNRLSGATDWLGRPAIYNYDAASNLKQILYPNRTSIGFTYDSANRLTNVVDSAPALPILTLGYALDPVGNRTALSVNGLKTNFAYDSLNELLSAQLGPLKSAWTYDAVGNRIKETSPLGTTSYAYDAADRLLSAGAAAFTYDRNGNQLTKATRQGTLTYSYDAANRLIAASARGIASTYSYDGDGNRVAQTSSAGPYAYVNDVATALPVVLNEQGPNGDITYAYGLGLIEEASSAFNYFYHYDGLGSIIALTDAAGKPQAAYAYDAWGNPLLTVTDNVGTKNKFRFTGEALDPGTQLYYLRARYYDPSVGRFITRDPVRGNLLFPATLDKYIYALNDPAVFRDPAGLSATTAFETANSTVSFVPNPALTSTTVAPSVNTVITQNPRLTSGTIIRAPTDDELIEQRYEQLHKQYEFQFQGAPETWVQIREQQLREQACREALGPRCPSPSQATATSKGILGFLGFIDGILQFFAPNGAP